MKVIGEAVFTNFFIYDKKDKIFIAEFSDLPKNFNPFGRVFDESCDEGFVLISTKTNKEVVFIFSATDKTDNNEIAGWYFTSYKTNEIYRCLIIND